MLSDSFNFVQIMGYCILFIIVFRLVCWWLIFRKMGLRPWLSLIPFVSTYMIFKRCWVVWPYIVLLLLTLSLAVIVPLTGYLNMNIPMSGNLKSYMQTLAMIAFLIINVLMYKRLAFAFGHDILFQLGLLFLGPIFLGILAFSRKEVFDEERTRLRGMECREYLRENRSRANKVISAVSGLAILFTVVVCVADFMMTEHQPAFLVVKNNNKIYEATAGKIKGKSPVVSPRFEDSKLDKSGVRDLYFPDKAGNKETTVYMYMIGSDLEEANGSASVNLAQIRDATKASPNLRFIIQAGGSGRWFTKGFKQLKTGRYMIKDGKVTMLKDLGWNVCMSKPKTLKSFLKWANAKYPSDRKMLFFWDHGGAVSGFGKDYMNPRVGQPMMSMSELRDALKAAGAKYDLIGFDACLMQSLEVGLCLEPYADYLLASEEGEPSTGMYYTTAFRRLAKEPDMSTVRFGTLMCSSFDESLALINKKAQAGSTLSMVDLRFLPVVRKTFFGYLKDLHKKFRKDKDSFLAMSAARARAYEFQMDDQIDLIDYLENTNLSKDRKSRMIRQIKDAVVVRNEASANHINGLAVYMPYDNLYSYDNIYKEMKKLGLKAETKIYNDFASIIGSQKRGKENDNYGDYSYTDWFVKDFKDYDVGLLRKDIPLKKHKGDPQNHVICLSEEEWKLVTNYELGLRMKVGERYADLGSDNIYDRDENGHYMVGFDKTWVAINDVVVALHPGPPIQVDEDTIVYTGTVDATLNFITPVTIYLRWVNEGDHEGEGEVIGYLPADEDSDNVDKQGMPRGYKKFKYNNLVTFLYDWYDKDGNYKTTAMGHLPILVGTGGMQVTQKDIRSEEYEYYGILYDVAGQRMLTRKLTHKREKVKKSSRSYSSEEAGVE